MMMLVLVLINYQAAKPLPHSCATKAAMPTRPLGAVWARCGAVSLVWCG